MTVWQYVDLILLMSLEAVLGAYNDEIERERSIWTYTPEEAALFKAEMERISAGFEAHIIGRPIVGHTGGNGHDIYEAIDMGLRQVDRAHKTVAVQPERQLYSLRSTRYTLGLFVPGARKPGPFLSPLFVGNSDEIGVVSVSTADPMEQGALAERLKFGKLLDQVLATLVEVDPVGATT